MKSNNPFYCDKCGEVLSPENDGQVLFYNNEKTEVEFVTCDDCQCIEWGYRLPADELYYYNLPNT